MKKLTILILILVMSLLIIGCGNEQELTLKGIYSNHEANITIAFDGNNQVALLDETDNSKALVFGQYKVGEEKDIYIIGDEINSYLGVNTLIFDASADVIKANINTVECNLLKSGDWNDPSLIEEVNEIVATQTEIIEEEKTDDEKEVTETPKSEEKEPKKEEAVTVKQEESLNSTTVDATNSEPYTMTSYSGEEQLVLNFVQSNISWYDSWLKQEYPNGLTEDNGCDWTIVPIDNVWFVTLYQFTDSKGWNYYDCKVTNDGTNYVLTEEKFY